MTSPAAEEASHMFFGAAAKKFAGNIMATHPPLEKRILAIEPTWNGQFTASSNAASTFSSRPSPNVSRFATNSMAGVVTSSLAGSVANTAGSMQLQAAPGEMVEQVGTISDDGIAIAQQLIAEQGDALTTAAHDPFEARALIYAMLIDPEEHIARAQLDLIARQAEPGVPPHVKRLLPSVKRSDHVHLLTLLEMAMPALKELSYN